MYEIGILRVLKAKRMTIRPSEVNLAVHYITKWTLLVSFHGMISISSILGFCLKDQDKMGQIPSFCNLFFFFSFLVFIEFIIFTQPKMKRKENIIRPSYITPPSHTSGSVKLPPHMCGVRFDSFHCKKNK